jgi:hypothetical protein
MIGLEPPELRRPRLPGPETYYARMTCLTILILIILLSVAGLVWLFFNLHVI